MLISALQRRVAAHGPQPFITYYQCDTLSLIHI